MDFPNNSARLIADHCRDKDVGGRELCLACCDVLKWGVTHQGTGPQVRTSTPEGEGQQDLSKEQVAEQLERACEHHAGTGSQPAGVGLPSWLPLLLQVAQLLLDALRRQPAA